MAATDPVSLGIAALAGAVAVLAGWYDRPRRPDLEAERWFKLTLATLLRGRVEAAGGGAADWEAAVTRFVRYHPLGRLPERKLTNPAAEPPGPWLEGERGLHEALARETLPAERLAVLYERDERGRQARLADPAELGAAYAPSVAAGAGVDWDTVAAWGAGTTPLGDRLLARLGARWVVWADDPHGLGAALAVELGVQAISGPPDVGALGDDPVDRCVLVAEGERVVELLQALVERPGLRDRVLAVISLGGPILGRTDLDEGPSSAAVREDWMGRWWGQEHLDTEVVRLTPYFAVQWLDRRAWPPGVEGLPLQNARFPEPARQRATVETIEAVDLGPLPVDPHLPLDLVSRALMSVVCGWLASRR